ncbi:gp53-like domain-containing protein [Xenorhabdus griffiniae]|uniref:Putative tail fiber protein gp53-like C-terminal domain-containing protein n=2 Tax=Xenorhabdus griffiniae TaxID=351672 RepID=A0ABY9XKV2_9GAMM|nr:hypothetical protein [Xenorhabdus griffiniae]WMV73403.1 hypothetical protein QL128_05055 [Xenorhabdus griffiniae]WNH03082.1 hypothetical protein QL112_005060 [Xenorhabdus griffiniae]
MKNLGLTETVKLAAGALPRSGGEVTGNITISTDTEIAWRRNTDMAAIGFKNTGDADTDSYMWFKTGDNGNEYFKWQHSLSGGGTTEWMSLKSDNLRVKGHQVYHEGNKPTAATIGAYTKSEADSKYQLKGSFGFGGSGGTVFSKNNNEFLTWIRRSGVSPEFFRNSGESDYTHIYGAGLLLKAGDTYASFSVNYATARVKVVAGNNAGTANSPIKELAFTDDSYTKSESDNRFIQLNTHTKTSGYILSKTANYLEDTNARHLGRSGFLRPNGIDNLGGLAIHVAHPSVEGPQHSRGISFSYGSSSDSFGISTYAFDKDGKFRGQKKILTEDDLASIRSTSKKEPNGWWKCGDTGLIIQWGKWKNPYKTNDLGGGNGIPHGTNFTQKFAIPFSNVCFNIMPNITNSDTRDNINSPAITVHSFDKEKFIFQTGEHWSVVQNSFIYWLAIGY